MSKKSKKIGVGMLLVGAAAVTAFSLWNTIKDKEKTSEREKRKKEERYGNFIGGIKQEWIDYLKTCLSSAQNGRLIPPVLDIQVDQFVKLILNPYQSVPECLKGVDRETLRAIAHSGFDDKDRLHCWLYILGMQEITQYCSKYHNLLPILLENWEKIDEDASDISLKFREIRKDLPRTHRGEPLSKDEQTQLRNVLGIYAILDKEVGYTQGMNVIAQFLLELTEDEPLAFGILCQLMRLNDKGPNPPRESTELKKEIFCEHAYTTGCSTFNKSGVEGYGMRYMFAPCLPACIISLLMFELVLSEQLPHIHTLFQEREISTQMFASEWFFTIFSYVIPEKDVFLRVMDLFLVDGYKALFRVGLAIIHRSYPYIQDLESDEIVTFLKKFPSEIFVSKDDGKIGDSFIKQALGYKITNRGLHNIAKQILVDFENKQENCV